jgi:heme/copper-type cytochrome/quinol oxidase subunit 3
VRLFITAETMLFGSLFAGYVMLRAGSSSWPAPIAGFTWVETLLLVGASASFGAKRSQLVVSNTLGLTFVVIKALSDMALIGKGITPSFDLRWACYFTLTGVLAIHVLCGAAFTGWMAGPGFPGAGTLEPGPDRERWLARIEMTRRYWLLLDAVWLVIVVSFYIV